MPEATEYALGRFCITCEAKPGKPCKTATGEEMTAMVHAARARVFKIPPNHGTHAALQRMSQPGNSN